MSSSVGTRMWRLVGTVCLILASSSVVLAQPLMDPTKAEFTPSADHSAVDGSGTSLLSAYRLDLYVAGQSSVTRTVSLGKPAPEADGLIRVNFIPLLSPPLVPGTTYEARVAAVGPGGETTSALSDTFGFTLVCAPAITPTSRSLAAGAATGSVTVTVAAGCAWTAVSNASWITVTSGASGSASGTVAYSVAANTATTQRTGTIAIAGSTLTVTQAGAACTATVTPGTVSLGSAGGSGTISVTVPSECAWTGTSSAQWLTVVASGSGTGSATYNVAANTAATSRTASLTIAGRTVSVTQSASAGKTPGAPSNLRIIANGGQ